MAFQSPSLVHDTTNTPGTGSYALNNSSAAGRRGLADAVTDGHAANGDTVEYWVVDTTTSGGSLQFEYGLGTISGGGATLSRTVYKSTNGNNAVSWGAGGTRDVIIGLGGENAARLNAAQTFTANQSITGTNPFLQVYEVVGSPFQVLDISATEGRLSKTAATGAPTIRIDPLASDGSSASTLELFRLVNTSGARLLRTYKGDGSATVTSSINADTGAITCASVAATGNVEGATITKGGVAVEAFPTGGTFGLPMKTTTAPTGWTKSTADNDACLRVVSGTPGASGGTRAISSATVGAHTLTVAQMPSHSHTYAAPASGGAGTQSGTLIDASSSTHNSFSSSSQGGDGSHDHALALKYVDCIVATKN